MKVLFVDGPLNKRILDLDPPYTDPLNVETKENNVKTSYTYLPWTPTIYILKGNGNKIERLSIKLQRLSNKTGALSGKENQAIIKVCISAIKESFPNLKDYQIVEYKTKFKNKNGKIVLPHDSNKEDWIIATVDFYIYD
jgi:hypothetical protein